MNLDVVALAYYQRRGFEDVGATTYAFQGEHFENRVLVLPLARDHPPKRGSTVMPIALPTGQYRCESASLAGSEFLDANLEDATFHDVNLRRASFLDVALTGATIRNACLGDVTIADANLTGMRIEGILVTELLRVYRAQAGT